VLDVQAEPREPRAHSLQSASMDISTLPQAAFFSAPTNPTTLSMQAGSLHLSQPAAPLQHSTSSAQPSSAMQARSIYAPPTSSMQVESFGPAQAVSLQAESYNQAFSLSPQQVFQHRPGELRNPADKRVDYALYIPSLSANRTLSFSSMFRVAVAAHQLDGTLIDAIKRGDVQHALDLIAQSTNVQINSRDQV
jgi:hypothetical protein